MTPLHLATEAARAVGLDPVRTIPGGTGCSFLDTPRGRDGWAFTCLRPVLLAAGCMIEDFDYGAYVREPDSELYPRTYSCISHDGNEDGAPISYFTALAMAILWLKDNAPDALAAAVEKAGRG